MVMDIDSLISGCSQGFSKQTHFTRSEVKAALKRFVTGRARTSDRIDNSFSLMGESMYGIELNVRYGSLAQQVFLPLSPQQLFSCSSSKSFAFRVSPIFYPSRRVAALQLYH
jgi:hypothetical protein